MHIFSAARTFGLLTAIGLGIFGQTAAADETTRAGLECGSGRSIGLNFCYDAELVEPALPLGNFAYVLTTPDRSAFITVSLIDAPQGLPGLDLNNLSGPGVYAQSLPLGADYQFASRVKLIDPDTAQPDGYSATLESADFGFQVQAVRLGQVPGGTVRLALMTIGPETDVAGLTQAFAQVTGTLTILQ